MFKTIRNAFKVKEPVSYTHLDVYKRQAQGRAYRIEKRMSHITVVLNER